jgi:hypothetical protein
MDTKSAVEVLVKYVELGQQKGAYLLPEADVLKRATDVLVKNTEDPELTQNISLNVLVQGVTKGQKAGAYTLADASLIHKAIQFFQAPPVAPTAAIQESTLDDDLASLSDPIPFKMV